MENIKQFKEWISQAKKIVVFTGAGISVPSGIPDFRSAKGIFNEKFQGELSPEIIVSNTFFTKYPKVFYDFYFEKMIYPSAKPNIAHKYFARLEQNGKDITVITQNIDGLHQKAGSKHVYELHGAVDRNYCMRCQKFYALSDLSLKEVPYCSCGGKIKPDVVLYEERLNDEIVRSSIHKIREADLLIIVGTSLSVYPAASFVDYFKGEHIVLINKSNSAKDEIADLFFKADILDVIHAIEKN